MKINQLLKEVQYRVPERKRRFADYPTSAETGDVAWYLYQLFDVDEVSDSSNETQELTDDFKQLYVQRILPTIRDFKKQRKTPRWKRTDPVQLANDIIEVQFKPGGTEWRAVDVALRRQGWRKPKYSIVDELRSAIANALRQDSNDKRQQPQQHVQTKRAVTYVPKPGLAVSFTDERFNRTQETFIDKISVVFDDSGTIHKIGSKGLAYNAMLTKTPEDLKKGFKVYKETSI